MNEQCVRAIVLGTRDVKEIDRVVFFLEDSDRKRSGFAKGAKHSKKRFVNTLEPLALIQLVYKETPRGLWLQDSKLERWFITGSESRKHLGVKHIIREVLLRFLPDDDPNPGIFELLLKTLQSLCETSDAINILILFLFRFGFVQGYLPTFERCSVCGNELARAKKWVWQLTPFRTTCAFHRLSGTLKWEWDLEILRVIQAAHTWPVDHLWKVKVSRWKRKGLLKNLSTWLEITFHQEIKSFKWLERILEGELDSVRLDSSLQKASG